MQQLAGVRRIDVATIVLTLVKNPCRGKTLSEHLTDECFRILGRDEMVMCGSRWRHRIANEPLKVQRVLADMQVQQREGKHIRYPGGYAEDLWKRFA